MAELWAVDGDPNTDGGGGLIPAHGSTVKINGLAVIVHGPDHANPDDSCPVDEVHCDPMTAAGSGTVKCYGLPVHRNNDARVCGATTVVAGQGTVKVG
jgi:uncharacterized Zn-binding protein involved in type VI secretion